MALKHNPDYIMEEKIDRLEAHFREFKKDVAVDREINRDIRNALVGSNLNGNKGIVNLIDEIDERLLKMEKRQVLFEEVFSGFKWSVGTIIGGIVTFFIWFFTKNR